MSDHFAPVCCLLLTQLESASAVMSGSPATLSVNDYMYISSRGLELVSEAAGLDEHQFTTKSTS